MAPSTIKRKAAAGTKDIRNFFGTSQPSQPKIHQVASSGTSKIDPAQYEVTIVDADSGNQSKPKAHSTSMNGGNGSTINKMPPHRPVKTQFNTTPLKRPSSRADQIDVDDDSHVPKTRGLKRKTETVVMSSDEEEEGPPRKKMVKDGHTPKAVPRTKRSSVLDLGDDSEDELIFTKKIQKPSSKKGPPKTKPRSYKVVDSESEAEMTQEGPKKAGKPAKKKGAPSKKMMGEDKKVEGKQKPDYATILARRAAGPAAPGSKQIPAGEPNCLAGLAFVFTGELDSLSRDEATDLIKRYGGRVTGAPSGKTNFVVLGNGAGPGKLKAIEKHKLATLNEDELLEMIRTRKGFIDEKTAEKLRKEEVKIREMARAMENEERQQAKAAQSGDTKRVVDPASQLWTTKYAPTTLKDICGNKTQVEKIQLWLHDWPASLKVKFKHPGKNGLNTTKALLITGPPGVGKTTSAHLCAKLEGYTVIELNASDVRSKKLLENATNINNTSLDGWMHGGGFNAAGVQITDRTVLIMDEVDGMSAGDRGGVGALNVLIKKSKVPIICIANDAQSQKLKPLQSTTAKIAFQRPQASSIRSRILSILFKEKMKIPSAVVDELITGSQSDIRQVLTMLSTWKLSRNDMNFDEGKELVRANEKYSIMTPFTATNKILGPYLFSKTCRETLNEKIEYYFHEPAFMPLFIQENYAKMTPANVGSIKGPEQDMKHLELLDRAAASISDGDMVDVMIRGGEMHWSLMPLHACLSTVRPSSFVYGYSTGYNYKDATSFPVWLGQNSKQNKLQRQLNDIQAKMRAKITGDKTEIRAQYLPSLYPRIVHPLIEDGAVAIPKVIETLDEYYLSKEDWDAIVELGVGDHSEGKVAKAISTACKTSFTKKYNAADHPIAFHRGTDLGPIKKIAAKDVPDIEEAFDVDDTIEDDEDEAPKKPKKSEIALDSLIREKKPKGQADDSKPPPKRKPKTGK